MASNKQAAPDAPGPARAQRGAVTTAFPAATEAGLAVLRAGGNAFDAAAASAWALCVCEPSGSGLGGSAIALLKCADGRVVAVDGQTCAPGAVSRATVGKRQQQRGHRACTIPSFAAVLGHIHGRHGLLSRSVVMAPAIALAEDGYRLTQLQCRQQAWCLAALRAHVATASLFLKDGQPHHRGDRFRQPALAKTLRRLSREGTDDFYLGRIARDLVADMADNDGLITRADLASFPTPSERPPVSASYRDCTVWAPGSPAGGARVLRAIGLLEQTPSEALRSNPDLWYETLARVSHDVYSEPTAPLGRHLGAEGPGDTTHLCAADVEGNVVAITQSIQSVFGAKVANARLGFLYNNYLCTLPRRAHPYQLAAGRVPRSNASPTLVLGADGLLVLGSAGSRRITSSIVQTISNIVDRGLSLGEALSAPRIHATVSGEVHVEEAAATEALRARLAGVYRSVRIRPRRSFFMGAVQAIQWHRDGCFVAAADPRRDGSAGVW